MFGISFTEILLIAVVAIIVVGPKKLPQMLGTLGNWIGQLRRMGTEMRRQTGLDELLRDEGLDGGLSELRGLMRGDLGISRPRAHARGRAADPYDDMIEYDRTREYPVEGPDAFGAIAEDLLEEPADRAGSANGGHPEAAAPAAPAADESSAPAEGERPGPSPS